MNAEDYGLNLETAQVKEGPYKVIMPQLITTGFDIWTPADFMDAGNAAVGTPRQDKVWEAYVDTAFGIAGTKEAVYLDPNSLRLQAITVSTVLNSALPLSDADRAGMQRYQRSDLILGRDLSKKEAGKHPLWLAFADGDQGRLDRYVENTFRLGKDKYSERKMMGVYLSEDGDLQELRFASLRCCSLALGNYFNNGNAQLVGVRRNTTPDSELGRIIES